MIIVTGAGCRGKGSTGGAVLSGDDVPGALSHAPAYTERT
jgi:hypothetical protein